MYRLLLIISLVTVVGYGCSTRSTPAPVVDRSFGKSLEPVPAGYYRVKRGDTLIRIALDHGQSFRDVAEWNGISDVNQIEVDQLIRVVPPKSARKAEVKVDNTTAKSKELTKNKVDESSVSDTKLDKQEPVDVSGIKLSWPSKGNVIERFDEIKNKGIDISGKLGDPVTAAADGKVVYAGNSLRGYGNLVIVKHDNTYLTAYAHNKTLLVKEGDVVKKAQKIAEMGNSDADKVKLHFELRKNGKPVDPQAYLPQ